MAFEDPTEGIESREPDRPGLARLEDGEVGECDANTLGQFGERHAACDEEFVEMHPHAQSDRLALELSEIRALAKDLGQGEQAEADHQHRPSAWAAG